MKINPAQLGQVRPLKPTTLSGADELEGARKLRDAYHDFVGKTFFGQMLKAMRSTVGKPAYFHGGQTEEAFRTQLDQHLADRMNDASAEQIAEPMFRLQFPRQAELIEAASRQERASLGDLAGLRRR
jgi:Rod binding domain-containing protein